MTFNEIVKQSVANKYRVEISYNSYNGENSIRQLSNLEYSNEFQKNYNNNHDYISAFCHLRNDKRTFKLIRIEKIRIVGSSEWVSNPSFGFTKKTKPSGCYIATMAYGDYEHPQVKILREFRDDVILKYYFGKLFVNIYYFISPKLVFLLKNLNTINRIIKKLLDKLIEKIIKY